MKISKLLNKKNYILFLFLIFFGVSSANEPVDIWNIDKSKIKTNPENKNQLEISNYTDEDDFHKGIYGWRYNFPEFYTKGSLAFVRNGLILPPKEPAVFELKNPTTNIRGVVL